MTLATLWMCKEIEKGEGLGKSSSKYPKTTLSLIADNTLQYKGTNIKDNSK